MSRIYFHSEYGESEVRGAERAMMGNLCSNLLVSLLVTDYAPAEHIQALKHLLPPDHYLHAYTGPQFMDYLRVYLRVGENLIIWGQAVSVFSLALNTAYVLGSDPVKLAARLHGQCEIWCYVEGPHRAWLAGIIEQGREIGLFREEMGWEATMALLRSRDDGPVVCSYSVCESFPNAGLAARAGVWTPPLDEESGERLYDDWYDLSGDEQWRMGIAAARSRPLLELTPDGWETFSFEEGSTGFDALACVTRDA